jgi:hypothetical protein
MKLNWVEKLAMNSPFRPVFQRREARELKRLGGEGKVERALEVGSTPRDFYAIVTYGTLGRFLKASARSGLGSGIR